jgi:tetraacyldisaccharide 4'-kinase
VSVGNIAFGGRGKTPTVALVAQILRDSGERVAILSRGYGRRIVEDGVTIVSDGTHLLADLDRAGDEPLMLARALPGVAVLVCDQRAVAGALAQHVLGATALVLDDGFQHRQMRRDVDLVLVTPGDLAGRRVPLGRLRESPTALARADATVVDGDAKKTSGVFFDEKDTRRLFRNFRLRRHTHAPAALAAGARVWVLAGIAGPARVARGAADAGYEVAGHWAPGDHHRYTRRDIARLARDVAAAGAVAVLTTAKDAERLRPFRPLPFDVHVLAHSVTLDPIDDGPAFADWLVARIKSARGLRTADRVS